MTCLTKRTQTYATHIIPLECDVYSSVGFPANSPVLLFFHSGGLVSGARSRVPPWLVQTCYQRQWPLVSASYRLLPQVDAKGLLEDARAAYSFARHLGGGSSRDVIVAGASAGFSLGCMIAHHTKPLPVALLSITGVPTFQHHFFSSSILHSPQPITDEEAQPHMSGPTCVGTTATWDPRVFRLDKLLPSGAKNPGYRAPEPRPEAEAEDSRGDLWEYYLYWNKFPSMMRDTDEGFPTDIGGTAKEQNKIWPRSIFIQGDADESVAKEVTMDTADALGSRATLFMAVGQGHLFEAESFIEDDGAGMDAVRLAVQALDRAVAGRPVQ